MNNETQLKRVNVGCGPKARQNWINVDIQDFPSVDMVMDVTKVWDFSNLEYIYAEHFLEHLEIEDGVNFLINAGASLKKGGWIRLSTPNVEWVLKTHYKWDKLNENEMLLQSVTSINRAFYGWGHKFLYSPWILEKLLNDVGYKNIRFCDYGVSQIKAFENIEEHGKYSVYDSSPSVLIIEAEKKNDLVYPDELMQELTQQFIRHAKAKG